MATEREIAAMRRALAVASSPGVPRGPNPRVGAVILDASGEPVAEGYHRGAGTPHAEVDALNRAGAAARGGTAVVTLEPCNHIGRTGPCAEALISAGIRRVVYAQADTSDVAAGGSQTLSRAGIDVESGVLEEEAAALNEAWSFSLRHRRPKVTWKFAASLDGRSAAADGTSKWITGPEARRDVHVLRAECDAILVGTGTALADDPRLTVRRADGEAVSFELQPLRAVMGLRDLPAHAALLDGTAPTIRLSTREPTTALKELTAAGCSHVWLEGGPRLAAAFLGEGLVDEVIAYVAPVLLGSGPAAVADLGISTIAEAVQLDLVDVARIGVDVRLRLRGPS
ncbi:MAG: bifunctional diaminohydroxyphosphoribosylaminopyrimidine deaminase/5-amino-6-(5-phosphoribosylamino)uracil reductase RibD [Nocardioidaceae bacterium]|nr:bifunctional diaminohydroxyphosphoribosylaminopyrimidine deaminase/5-amino-6-(5-phosphoribosylamino)uracil reductase RibD [Nocardioidaceae bacterium]